MPRQLEPGQFLQNGAIEVIDQIGSGGVGEVYRVAVLIQGQREIMALKCFNPKILSQTEFDAGQMVHRESTAVSKIRHPGIVRLHQIEVFGKLPFIIEEYFVAGDLKQLIDLRQAQQTGKDSLFSPHEIVQVGYQVSSALMAIHQQNIYHGDLKPHNICLRSQNPIETVIVDFGQAGFMESNILASSEQFSTLAYLPPERTGFVKLAGNAGGDLYSLGVTLYEIATGTPPFSGRGRQEIINRLLYEVPRPLAELFPKFPVALSDIIAKLLRKDIQDRYHSAFGLSADLERCLLGLENAEDIIPFALGSKDKLRELNYRIPMVGRTEEIAILQRLFAAMQGSCSTLALIGAPSGTGKSRLAFEVLKTAKAHKVLLHNVKFSEYERNLPLSAVTLLLIEHCHYLKSVPSLQLKQWQDRIVLELGDRLQLIAERYSFYQNLIPIIPRKQSLEGDGAGQTFNQTLGEFLGLLPACSEPQVIFIDDLQWADWQSLQVFTFLAKKIIDKKSKNLLFIGTYRSNEVLADHPMKASLLTLKNQFTHIELGPLREDEAKKLVESLLDETGDEIEELAAFCYRFTAGNPFYIYEYLKSAFRHGIYDLNLATQTWHFHPDKVSSQDLSSGVASLVAERILSLLPIQQAIIGIASIAGQAMSKEAVLHLLPTLLFARQLPTAVHDQALELAYQELLQKNLLAQDAQRFKFFHDKIQEACYDLLSDDEKRSLHFEFGCYSLHLLGQPIEEANDGSLFQVAYHICRAQNKQLAEPIRKFLFQAAKAANHIFAYDKVREYLQTILSSLDAKSEFDPKEKFEALVMMADTLVLSDQIQAGMLLYEELLKTDCEPLQRAKIYVKKVEFCHSLFEYKKAGEACSAALAALGVKTLSSEPLAYLYILTMWPFLVLFCIYFRLFGVQNQEITSELERVRLHLRVKMEVSQYLSKPIVAIANIFSLTFALLKYKDNEYRAILFCYWGIILGAFGVRTYSNRCFAKAYAYFDKNPNPAEKGFGLFAWAMVIDLPQGDLLATQKKLEDALYILKPVGESFWSSMTTMGLIILDFLGAESGQAGIRTHELVELWKKVGYAATPLGSALRYYLESENEEQIEFLQQKVTEADTYIQSQGYDSLDSVYGCVGLGEFFDLRGNVALAEYYAHRAFTISFRRVHRAAHALHAPIIYARILSKKNKLGKAFAILVFAWFNQLLNANVFRPQTFFETGRWLWHFGLQRLGRNFVKFGIRYATDKGWLAPEAEGRLLYAQLLGEREPELALINLVLAREYFETRSWKFHAKLCEQEIAKNKLMEKKSLEMINLRQHSETSRHSGSALRQQVETHALMDILLKLSAITEKDPLFGALMEALCQATGSELAVLYFEKASLWEAEVSHNVDISSQDKFRAKVDNNFVQEILKLRSAVPTIRQSEDQRQSQPLTSGSAMLLPLIADAQVYGYCYLANTQLSDIFDTSSIGIAQPIATQGAIALHNIRLNAQLAVERDETAHLNQTLEHRVIEQTRDIKGIMQHIEMGICTVSGQNVQINRDYSLHLETLLGSQDLKGKPLLPLLLAHSHLSSDEKDQVTQALSSTIDEFRLGFELNSHLLPSQLTGQWPQHEPFNFELGWIPICDDDQNVAKVLLTIQDVTELRGLQLGAAKKDLELQIISEILALSEREWLQFLQSSKQLLVKSQEYLEVLRSGSDFRSTIKNVFIQVHTLKGNARSFGFKHMNEAIHHSEHFFAAAIKTDSQAVDQSLLSQELDGLAEVLGVYENVAVQKLGRSQAKSETLGVIVTQVYGRLQKLAQQEQYAAADLQPALHLLRTTIFKPLGELISQLLTELHPLALALGKAPPCAHLDLPELWLNQKAEGILRNCFVHLLRNALDHGIESPADREAKGKSISGKISIMARQAVGAVEVSLEDDGRGLNLDGLKAKGLQKSIITLAMAEDPKQVAALIFHADLSTAQTVTDVSGRGIGMAAVLEALREVGGTIAVQLTGAKVDALGFSSFKIIMHLPLDLFQWDEVKAA